MPLSFSSNRPPIILKQYLYYLNHSLGLPHLSTTTSKQYLQKQYLHIRSDSSLRSHCSFLKLCLFFHVLHILHILTSNLQQSLQTRSLSSLYQSRRKNPDNFFLVLHRLHFFSFFISIAFSSRYLIRFFSKLSLYLSSLALGHLLSLCSVLWHLQQKPVKVISVSSSVVDTAASHATKLFNVSSTSLTL